MKKREYCKIVILCGVLYMFCLFQFLGVSLGRDGGKKQAGMGAAEETLDGKAASMEGEAPQIAITFDDGPSARCTEIGRASCRERV